MTGLIFAIGVVVILLVALNAWGLRGRIPMLRSRNKVVAAAGWAVIVLAWLTVAGLAAPPQTDSPSSAGPPAALNPTASSSLTPSFSPTPTATPSPVATPTPTPTPIVATAPPTSKPVVPAPTKAPAPPPAPAFSYCGAPANPWHYNFCGGNLVYSPPSGICGYFACIASFWNEDIPNDGYVVQCVDGKMSLSGGERGGVCGAGHGGPGRTLYAP